MSIRIAAVTWFTFCTLLSNWAVAQIPWANSVEQAKTLAGQQQKLVLLHFYTDNCPPCRRLEQNVFPLAKVQQTIQRGYVPVKINVNDAPDLARTYNVFSYPTDIMTDARGREMYRTISPQDPNRYVRLLQSTYASYQAKLPHNPQIDGYQGAGSIAQAAANYTAEDAAQYAQAANQQLSQTQQYAQHVAQQNQTYGSGEPGGDYMQQSQQYGGVAATAAATANNSMQAAQQQAQQFGSAANQAAADYPAEARQAANDYMQSVQQYGAAAGNAANNYVQQTQQRATDYIQGAEQQAQQYGAAAGNAANNYAQQTQQRATDYMQGAKQQAQQYGAAAGNAVNNYAQQTRQTATDYMQGAKQQAQQYGAAAGNTVNAYTQQAHQAASGLTQGAEERVNEFLERQRQAAQAAQAAQGAQGRPTGQAPAAGANGPGSYADSGQLTENPYIQKPAAAGATPGAAPYAGAYASQADPAATPSVETPPTIPPTPQYQAPAAKTAKGRRPRGLEGFCPVTLSSKRKWAKGDSRYGAVHRSRTYLFANEAAQKEFLANPDKYAPLLSGYDPVAFHNTRQLVDGDRRYGLTYKDQMLLFSSEESLQQFEQSPETYMGVVRQAMSGQTIR